ncbi:pickpocket protein 28 [Ceratitis capitata]|uniref:pickpocket protein 28 n=1 Tax=Ceratitis capitata TaxID=7213 RepID=UPI000A121BB7|nr:pickpocket protein 28 [Ceratitis capitata]
MFLNIWKQNVKENNLKHRGKLHQPQRFHSKVLNPGYRENVGQRLRLAIVDTFWEYTLTTKVSGIWLLRQDRTHGISRKIPANVDPHDVANGLEYINAFTDQNWKAPAQESFKIADEVLRLNNISIYEAAKAVSGSCNDFVKRCYWGPCCSFNYNPKNLSYVPFSSNIFGIDGGLTIVGVEGSERNLSTGLIVLAHHPMDYVTEATSSVTITSNSESFVEISPTVQSSATEVLELSQGKRDCLISDDLELHSYRQAACSLACRTEAIMKKCQCVPYHIPNAKADYRECKLNDSTCYSQNYDAFKSVKCESCLPNCYDVTYSTLAYKTDLNLHNCSVSTHYRNTFDTQDIFIVRAYLSKQTVPAIRKVVVMSWIGLLSDLGGVFNLCLGISMVSLIEFGYYCTHRLYVNYNARSILLQPVNTSNFRK